ncbi:MAG: alpha-L-arabinofuranosidase C-terminal domain-containing protein [Phycisphaerales bacterium]
MSCRIFNAVVFLVCGLTTYLYGQIPLNNGSFDAQTPLSKWNLYFYGAKPEIVADRENRTDGIQSIKIASSELSDCAIAQEVGVIPGKLYSLTGWVRTENLNSLDSPVFGTIIVQFPNGKSNIAYGQNHNGTTPWTQEVILFTAPECGKIRISLFFTGYGKGTGTVWFDNIQLQSHNDFSAKIKISSKLRSNNNISPFQYGQFIEPFYDCDTGMWSEKLSYQSFEGITPFKDFVVFNKPKDFQYRQWYPTGAVNRGLYSLDNKNSLNGKVAQCIKVKTGEPCVTGLAQDGIAVKKGETYNFSVYLRSHKISNPVRILLLEQGKVLAQLQFAPAFNWQKFTGCLIPTADSVNASLKIEYDAPGTLWIDQISLMPVDSVFGWRKDVVAAIKEMKPGIIRWGGIAVEHVDWKNLVGDPDKRQPWIDPFWGGTHNPAAGLEEFVKLCNLLGIEPMICVRVTDSNAFDAAAEIEYFNGANDTPMGKWRAENGHPEPYNVKYWQIGNEQESTEYTKKLISFSEAMKKKDPSIKLLSSFPNPEILRTAPLIDYICPHHYRSDLAACDGEFKRLQSWIQNYGNGRNIKIAITEWNTTAGNWGLSRAGLWTLDNALTCAIYHNIMHLNADFVEISNRSDLINSSCAGCIQTDNYRMFKTPAYYVQSLYANKSGEYALEHTNSGCVMPNETSATITNDRKTMTIFFVNQFRTKRKILFDLSEFEKLKENIMIWTVKDTQNANQRDIVNSFDEPERINIVQSTAVLEQNRFSHLIPELSLSVFQFQITP